MTTRIYGFTALTGGGIGSLDKYPEAGMPALATDDYAFGHVAGVFYIYWFNGASAEAESPPDVIAPDSGSGRWILKGFSFAHNDLTSIDGGNVSLEEYYHLSSADYDALTDVNAQLVNLQSDGTPTFGALKITTGAGVGKVLVSDADGDLAYQDKSSIGFPAEVRMYAGASAPSGWLLCDGASYLRADYAALFAVIGTTYGSADGTHFNVPDFRGRSPIGVGTGTGGGASGTGLPTGGTALTAVARGGWKGEETHALTSAENATHSHKVNPPSTASGNASVTHTHSGTSGTESADHTHGYGTIAVANESSHTHTYSGDTGNESDHTHSYTQPTGGGTIGAGGSINNAQTSNTGKGSAHKHSFSGTASAGSAHTHTLSGSTGNKSATHTHTLTTGTESETHTHTVDIAEFDSGNSGSGTAHNTIQPVMGINFIIKT